LGSRRLCTALIRFPHCDFISGPYSCRAMRSSGNQLKLTRDWAG
jgi:hypothetical protein